MALLPTIKKSYSTFLTEPKRFFTSCIKRNLHFVIIASPNEEFVYKLKRWVYQCPRRSNLGWNKKKAKKIFQKLVRFFLYEKFYLKWKSTKGLMRGGSSLNSDSFSFHNKVIELQIIPLSRRRLCSQEYSTHTPPTQSNAYNFPFPYFRGYPSIVTGCYIDWLPDASALHLQQEALAVLSKAQFWSTYDDELRWGYDFDDQLSWGKWNAKMTRIISSNFLSPHHFHPNL